MPAYYLVPKKVARAIPAVGRAASWLEASLIRALFWSLARLSVERASAVSATLVGLVGPHTAMARRVRENLAIAFPAQSDRDLDDTTNGVFRHLGMAIAELIHTGSIWSQREQCLEFCIDPLARSHLEAGGASVFVTAHVGAWQLTSLISRHCDLDMTVVFAKESNPQVSKIVKSLRKAFGVTLLPTHAGVRPLLRELQAGNSIGLAMDTRLDTGEAIPFFGVDALTNTTPARLAMRTGAALIPLRGERVRPGRFRVSVLAPIRSPDAHASPADKANAMTREIIRHFEAWIREAPDQWICVKRRWPKADTGNTGEATPARILSD